YGANNATLVIAGDIDVEETKALVERWFGEIRRCNSTGDPVRQPAPLEATKSLYHLDNFATLPELQVVWPAVEQYHEDSYALSVLADILTGSKKAPLYRTIVEEKKLAPQVTAYLNASEIAGEFKVTVRANAGVDLDDVKAAIDESFALFEKEGVPGKELQRIKAQNEIALYNGISTVLNKTFQLAVYNEFKGDPGYLTEDARRTAAVTADDVMRVYEKYIKGRPVVMTSFVPKEQPDLALSGAEAAEIWQEEISETAEHEQVSQGEEADYDRTPSKYDRSEPALGKAPLLRSPGIWNGTLPNGMKVYGIQNSEVPLISFALSIRGGHWLDPEGKAGTANLLASMMMEGTKDRTPAELEEALGLLGSSINFFAGEEDLIVIGNTLAKNFDRTIELLTE
ncbi:MAG TPA: insulinase family protein, partial [Candidatus Krumholzibacterium sp.]|nr:insulinase family protein [Candidatus Krumholzibacterium sp.]